MIGSAYQIRLSHKSFKFLRKRKMMSTTTNSHHRLLFVLCCCLVFLLAACGSTPAPKTQATGSSTPSTASTATASTSPTPPAGTIPPTIGTPKPTPIPTTQTACPPQGTARAAVMPRLALGTHQTIVYTLNKGTDHAPTQGKLIRYDAETGQKTQLFSVTNAHVDQAQLSADGQWVLFSTSVSNRSAIELVRMDGQALQTLYCSASGIGGPQWSPDQKYLAFREGLNVSLLTVATGAYQLEVPSRNNWSGYVPRTWLDNTRLYLTPYAGTETPPLNVFLLDIGTAKVQPVLASPTLCGDFDSSIDGTQLFTSTCTFNIPMRGGPSSITVQPATGGPAKIIYSTPSYAITALRVASRTTLLFVIGNTTGINGSDSSHSGLWKVNIDGSGLTRLTSEATHKTTEFNPFSQYIWSTASRDRAFYAVQVTNRPQTYTLEIGSLRGGVPTVFASTADGTSLALVGWTTM
jgi:eukaryotic-like serine/threonine-protein kinase